MTAQLDKARKRAMLLWYLVVAIPWRKVRRLHDPSSDVVVWIHHRYPESWLRWILREDTIVKDVAFIIALCERNVSFRIVGGRKIEQVRRARILYTIHPYNPDRATDYSAGLMAALRRIESGGNTLLPSADEAEWWENKVFMHRRFDALGIHCPITTIIDADDHLDADSFSYPLLAKEPHSSGSMGVHKVESADELRAIHTRLHAEGKPELLVQELIDMGRDFRATCVGDQVVHHYFRINTADEWQPTSTSRGSVVDFETFPEQWRSYITDVIVKCGLRTGAFDICWSGDDLSTEPYILEVSPSYTPNPPPPTSFGDRPYYEFKKQLTGPDAFSRAFIQTVVEITRAMLDVYDIR